MSKSRKPKRQAKSPSEGRRRVFPVLVSVAVVVGLVAAGAWWWRQSQSAGNLAAFQKLEGRWQRRRRVRSRHQDRGGGRQAVSGISQSPANQRGEGRGVDRGRDAQGLHRASRRELPRFDLPVDIRLDWRPPAGDLLPGHAPRNVRGGVREDQSVGGCERRDRTGDQHAGDSNVTAARPRRARRRPRLLRDFHLPGSLGGPCGGRGLLAGAHLLHVDRDLEDLAGERAVVGL